MFSLLETIIAFAVIMLMLSLLVKSFTSTLKNHVDYYSKNLKQEVERFITGTLEEIGQSLKSKDIKLLEGMEWKRLGEEYLTEENMQWLLTRMGVPEAQLKLKNLRARLKVHTANVRYVFEKRTKNLALAVGLTLCLAMNINAFSIWETLYNDQQIRAKFVSSDYVDAIKKEIEKENPSPDNAAGGSTATSKDEERQKLEQQREKLREKFYNFRGEVNFGMGRIWTEKVAFLGFLYEFFGSLLTGILISIGAPYWHDILRIFAGIRRQKQA